MALVVRQYNYVAGALIIATQNNTNENTLYNLVNGNLDDDNIASITEAKITFDTVSGHDHDGSNSRKIDLTGAGFLLRGETTGTDHAIIGRSSSSGSHAGIAGIGETTTSYGGFFNHEASAGTSLRVEHGANGICMSVSNNAAGSTHTAVFKQNSTNTGVAAIVVDAVTSGNHALIVNNVAGNGVVVSQGAAALAGTKGVYASSSSTAAGVEPIVAEVTAAGASGAALRATSISNNAPAVHVQGQNVGMWISNHVATSSVQALQILATAAVTPDTSGWVRIYGASVTNSTTAPILRVEGKAATAGTLVYFSQTNTGADGPNGGASTDEWVLKVTGNGGDNDNAVFIDGYTKIEGNLYIDGDLAGSGSILASWKSFRIDHPLHPSTMELHHASVESPELKTIYDGIVELGQSGTAVVKLPDYFMALNKDFRYQLTVINSKFVDSAVVSRLMSDAGEFEIYGAPFAMVSWQVTGVRKDRYADANPFVVEKKKATPGYIHPEVWQ